MQTYFPQYENKICADEVVTVFNMAGQVLFRGRAADVDVKSGLYLIKGQHRSMKVSIK
ncbi:MAG: hypothetical protein PUD69_01300 [Paraprevotella sp.]|nr:hypothetical protein [Paraprevotella sp.]